jgi:hypothetical protein
MQQDNQPGVWCRSDNTFYYLETGPASGQNNIERLKRILTQRGLIKYNTIDQNSRQSQIKVIKLEEAKKEGYVVKPIYLNKHIKSVMETQSAENKNTSDDVNPWE